MTTNFGTYKNQYGKTVTDRGPSQGQSDLIVKLLAEKVIPNEYVAGLVDLFNTDDLSGQNAKTLIDSLIAAKSQIVAPSQLDLDAPRKPASDKQLHWINKLLAEKAIPADDAELVPYWASDNAFPGGAGRVMDYLFDAPALNAPEATKGFLGEVGQKVTVTGTITVFKQIDGSFGPTNLIVVTTPEGQAVKTFSNAKGFWGKAEGDVVTVTGTVKAFDTFKGSETTVISRPSVL